MRNFEADAKADQNAFKSLTKNVPSKSLPTDANARSRHLPRLLVSVRSIEEAELAIAGGAEILDVKEPSLGSLGMASFDEIARIARMQEIDSQEIPLSVALGELIDWTLGKSIPSLPKQVSFAKLGLNACGTDSNWQNRWGQVRTEFEQRAESQFHWVAVAYADSAEAKSPSVDEVVDAAIISECSGLLIDTWAKGNKTLLDSIGTSQLVKIAEACHSEGLFFALAGKLNQQVLTDLSGVPVDVLAIRSAACRGSDRTVQLESSRIKEFRNQISHSYAVR